MLPLVCLDVDGTMVGSLGEPSPGLWAAVDRARHRGQHLTQCTARVAAGPTRQWAERLDPDGWHIFHTGAALWRPTSGEVRASPLAADAVHACIAVGDERGWVVELYTWEDYAVDTDDRLAVEHAALLHLPFVRRPLDSLDGEVVRMQFVVPIGEMRDAIKAAPPGTGASGATSPLMPDAAFVSLILDGVSKASGVASVAGELGVEVDRVMMVGDGDNDLPAMRSVGFGVAMGDADDEVRAEADLIVAGVDQDGAAEAVDRSQHL